MKIVKKRKIIIFSFILIISILLLSICTPKIIKLKKFYSNPENLRALNYHELTKEDENVNDCKYVKFSAYFLRDLKDNGKANKLLGTCKKTNESDILYMDLNVLTNGYLKDAEITIEGKNFNYSMNMLKDDLLKDNYISDDVKTIELNQINAGTQKLIEGNIIFDLENNYKNYNGESTITLTGTHVSDDGTETNINKTIELEVDWYGELETELYTYGGNVYYNREDSNNDQISDENSTPENAEESNSEEDYTVSINFSLDEVKKELLLKENIVKLSIPELNGHKAKSVTCINDGIEQEYNQDKKELTINNKCIASEEGVIEKELPHSNTYTVNITYPAEAYKNLNEDTTIIVGVEGYYTAYNNTNEEFSDKQKSNTATGEINIIFNEKQEEGFIYNFSVNLVDKVYNSRTNNFIISKQGLLDAYEQTETSSNIDYTVAWNAYRGTLENVSSVIMKETYKELDGDKKEEAEAKIYGDRLNKNVIQDYVSNKGIYFEGFEQALGQDGKITIYNNDTNEEIKSFTIEELKSYSKDAPYVYENSIKHIRIETTALTAQSTLTAYNIKELDVEKIKAEFTKEEIQEVQLLTTYLTGVANIEGKEASTVEDMDSAYFQGNKSYAEISIENPNLSIQETTKNEKIYIRTIQEQNGDSKWKNGEFVLEFPKEIISMNLNEITVDNQNVTVSADDLSQKDGKYILKILTENENPETYTITVDCDLTAVPKINLDNKQIILYAYNEICNDYYDSIEDIFDVNNNGETEELVGTDNTNIEIITPSEIITYETVQNYNDKNDITIAPNIADIENEEKTARINIDVINNYPNMIDGLQILGKVPFEGNTHIINEGDIGSKFTANMTDEGIILPKKLQEKEVNIYYSDKENPTRDIEDTTNNWKLTEDVEDFSQIKTFLIILNEKIEVGEKYEFHYKVKIPESVQYNIVSYSTHAIYYNVETEQGIIENATEPNEVGIKLAKKYNLNVKTFMKDTDIEVPTVTYLLKYQEVGKNGESVEKEKYFTVNSGEDFIIHDLYVGLEYTMQQYSIFEEYELNSDIIQFSIDSNGNIILNGNVRKREFVDNFLKIEIENYKMFSLFKKLYKYSAELDSFYSDDTGIEGIKFTVTDLQGNYVQDAHNQIIGIDETINGVNYKVITTDSNGYIRLNLPNGLYKFTEVWAPEQYFNFGNDGVYYVGIGMSQDGITMEETVKWENIEKDYKYSGVTTKDGKIVAITGDNKSVIYTNEGKVESESSEKIEFNNKLVELEDGKIQVVDGAVIRYNQEENELWRSGSTFSFTAITVVNDGIVAVTEQGQVVKYTNEGKIQWINATKEYGYVGVTSIDNGIVAVTSDGKVVKYVEYMPKVEEKSNLIIANFSSNDNMILEKFENNNKIPIKITKLDDETGEKLSGARFGIYYKKELDDNWSYLTSIQSQNIDGTELMGNSELYYKIVEEQAPTDYELPEDESKRTRIFKATDSIQINYIEDLIDLSNNVKKGTTYAGQRVELMRDLDFSNPESYKNYTGNQNFTSIGMTGNSLYSFSGIFDGNGYEIKNISGGALFSSIYKAKICNLEVSGNITSGTHLAGLVGFAEKSRIINCYNKCTVNKGSISAGILCYSNGNNQIINCTNGGYIYGFGGIVAYGSKNDLIINCVNTGTIVGTGSPIGGIVGVGNNVNIVNCYNLGKVQNSSGAYTGGIVGQDATIINCFNVGEIDGVSYVGGIAGKATSIENCFNVGKITGNNIAPIGAIAGQVTKIDNCYFSNIDLTMVGTSENNDISGYKDIEYFNSKEFAKLLNENKNKIETEYKLADWKNNDFCTTLSEVGVNSNLKIPEIYKEVVEIWYVEDLVDIANNVNSGKETYEGKIVKLMAKTLDFKDSSSYRDPEATRYGNKNYSGGIKEALSNGEGFSPIGKQWHEFKGNFEGNGNIIKNLYINSNEEYCGLFGYINYSTISNLRIIDSKIYNTYSSGYIGALVGYSNESIISNVEVTGTIIKNGNYGNIGGIIGYASYGGIGSVINHVNIQSNGKGGNIGGISGYSMVAPIINSYNLGRIEITSNDNGYIWAGGI